MAQPGFVYILINASLPGCVKIGKTTRDSNQRAAELSSATGVPTPFVLAYETYVGDCTRAEEYVHALLDRGGHRRSANREFFNVTLPVAIDAVLSAKAMFEPETSFRAAPQDPELQKEMAKLNSTVGLEFADAVRAATFEQFPVWHDALEDAYALRYGEGAALQDPVAAIELYKQAAKLGAGQAYIDLAEMYADGEGCRADPDVALGWLKRGAEAGVPECWNELAQVYAGENYRFEFSPNFPNALKCWRRYFASVNLLEDDDPEGSIVFGRLRGYVNASLRAGVLSEDREVVQEFSLRFANAMIRNLPRDETEARMHQLRALVDQLG